MTEWLIRRFIKNADAVSYPAVRRRYGTLSSMTGIILNILLFLLKVLIGILSRSISILSDAFNNLSDCLSCLITLFGYRIAAKPADREHPFGHGRSEYIAGLLIAVVIFLAGFELLFTSIQRLIHPSEVNFSWTMALILGLSIGVKLWMSAFYGKLGERINSSTLKASSQDSRNDVLSTGISLAAMLLSMTSVSFPFDGAAGVVISLFILKSGWDIANEIISQLLGKPADRELTDHIREQILSHEEILGVHDMIIHDYGPGVQIGSAHAEVDSAMTLVAAHDALDAAEEEILKLYNVTMTLHADPVDVRDERAKRYKETFEEVLKGIDEGLTLHDFRLRVKGDCEEAAFDVLIPYDCALSANEIDIQLKEACEVLGNCLSVTYDHDYTGEAQE